MGFGSATATTAGPTAGSAPAATAVQAPRERINIDAGWRFALGHAGDPSRDFGYVTAPFFFAKAGNGGGPASPKLDDRAAQSRLTDTGFASDQGGLKRLQFAGAPHGMCVTHADRINAELMKF